jgi:DNA-binding NarL/FixJ family response regulator
MNTLKTITILLVDDHEVVREGLAVLLNLQDDIKIVCQAENGHQAIAQAATLRPDIVVMDIAMPLLNGLEATRQILRDCATTKIILLSAHSDDAYVQKAISLGVSGYLIKQTAAQALADAIRQVARGKTFFSPLIAKRLADQERRARANGSPYSPKTAQLSSRESEVLQLIAEGNANKMTADILNISIKTVEKHRQSLMEKLNIHDTAGLTRHAISTGVIESSVQVTII